VPARVRPWLRLARSAALRRVGGRLHLLVHHRVNQDKRRVQLVDAHLVVQERGLSRRRQVFPSDLECPALPDTVFWLESRERGKHGLKALALAESGMSTCSRASKPLLWDRLLHSGRHHENRSDVNFCKAAIPVGASCVEGERQSVPLLETP